jgi:hypothetical protein
MSRNANIEPVGNVWQEAVFPVVAIIARSAGLYLIFKSFE